MVDKVVRCNKESMQKGMDLSSLNGYKFVHLISVEVFLKRSSVFPPPHTIRHYGYGKVPSDSTTNKWYKHIWDERNMIHTIRSTWASGFCLNNLRTSSRADLKSVAGSPKPESACQKYWSKRCRLKCSVTHDRKAKSWSWDAYRKSYTNPRKQAKG